VGEQRGEISLTTYRGLFLFGQTECPSRVHSDLRQCLSIRLEHLFQSSGLADGKPIDAELNPRESLVEREELGVLDGTLCPLRPIE
jgi:hypothetical protein